MLWCGSRVSARYSENHDPVKEFRVRFSWNFCLDSGKGTDLKSPSTTVVSFLMYIWCHRALLYWTILLNITALRLCSKITLYICIYYQSHCSPFTLSWHWSLIHKLHFTCISKWCFVFSLLHIYLYKCTQVKQNVQYLVAVERTIVLCKNQVKHTLWLISKCQLNANRL